VIGRAVAGAIGVAVVMLVGGAGAAGCKANPGPPGSSVPPLGACRESHECMGDAVCHGGVCMSPPRLEQALIEDSGVIPSTAELPAGGGRPIRVRTTRGEHTIFAACGATERLVGGGCQDLDDTVERDPINGWPGGYSPTDTLGARWYCAANYSVMAYALCQDATASSTAPAPAPPAPSPDAAPGHSRHAP